MSGEDDDPFDSAAAAHAEGRLDAAAAGYARCLERDPRDSVAMGLLGAVRVAQGSPVEGERLLRAATELDPADEVAWLNLGIALLALGRPEEALRSIETARAIRPNSAESSVPLAEALLAVGRAEESLRACNEVAADQPEWRASRFSAARALSSLGRRAEAAQVLRGLLARGSDREAAIALRGLLAEDPTPPARLESLRLDAALRPDDPAASAALAVALGEAGLLEECAERWSLIAAARPEEKEPHFQLGRVLAVTGRREQAVEAIRRAIAISPRDADAWLILSMIHRYRGDDGLAPLLRAMETDLPSRTPRERRSLHYALAKMHQDLGEHDEAFRHFAAGAALMREVAPSNLAAEERLMRLMQDVVPLERWRVPSADPSRGERCILVVGMPRSGTTLVEQVLASHPMVHGAGELRAAPDAANAVVLERILAAAAGSAPADALRAFGEEYLRRIPTPAPPRTLVCDKQPQNFRLLGPLAAALPGARIVHVRRDPRDVGLSCFEAMFAEQGWSFDLREIARYLRSYRDLMAHWDRCLGDRIVTVRYEALASDPGAEIPRLLAALGLSFDERCLRPHESPRAVNTASIDQVRRPISAASVGRWRRYERHLAPMLEELGDVAGF
ncbi:MAG: tetratricopeptide repeat protein [Phycisphaerae bacterium]|nr:tetratricopeptide repeat protein [Phycisphaerae bacterium]